MSRPVSFMRLLSFFPCIIAVLSAFHPCGEPTLFTPMLLHASPEKVQYGTNMSFFVYFAHTGEPVKDGALEIQTKLYDATLYHQSYQMCKFFECPVQSGNSTWIRTFTWPISIAGTYKTTLQLKNESNVFLCLTHDLVIPWF